MSYTQGDPAEDPATTSTDGSTDDIEEQMRSAWCATGECATADAADLQPSDWTAQAGFCMGDLTAASKNLAGSTAAECAASCDATEGCYSFDWSGAPPCHYNENVGETVTGTGDAGHVCFDRKDGATWSDSAWAMPSDGTGGSRAPVFASNCNTVNKNIRNLQLADDGVHCRVSCAMGHCAASSHSDTCFKIDNHQYFISDNGVYCKNATAGTTPEPLQGRFVDVFQKDANVTYNYGEFTRGAIGQDLGREYLKMVRLMSPEMFNPGYFKQLAYQNTLHELQAVEFGGWAKRQIPTMMRYWKLTSDISWLFGNLNNKSVLEIGAAWGTNSCCSPRGGMAQALLTRFPHIAQYTLFDPTGDHVELAAQQDLLTVRPWDEDKVVMFHTLPEANRKWFSHGDPVDLCVSDYAFSEMPLELAVETAHKVLGACRAGFFTWNSLMLPLRAMDDAFNEATNNATFVLDDEVPNPRPSLPGRPPSAPNHVLAWGPGASWSTTLRAQFQARHDCWARLQRHPTEGGEDSPTDEEEKFLKACRDAEKEYRAPIE